MAVDGARSAHASVYRSEISKGVAIEGEGMPNGNQAHPIPSTAVDDLIEVRTDEAFDVDALARWASSQSGLPAGTPAVTQFGGDKANLTYLLTYPDVSELVLRRPPLGPVATSSHDMGREYGVLSRLWQSFDLPHEPSAIATIHQSSERRSFSWNVGEGW